MKNVPRCAHSLGSIAFPAFAAALMATCHTQAQDASIDVAAWVKNWPARFSVVGGKSEPAYVEAINIDRHGDVFTTIGGAPAWEKRAVETVSISSAGKVTRVACPSDIDCQARPAVSFLSSAWLLGAYRQRVRLGRATPEPYGMRQVVCIPAERIGVTEAVLDPCFDLQTGAVLAQRHRLSGRFDGPSLDPGSIRISLGAKS